MFFKAECVSSKGINKNGRKKNAPTAEMLILQSQEMKENLYVLEL